MDELPLEIRFYIFDHLNIHDRRVARQVSRNWNNFLLDPRYTKNEVLRFFNCFLGLEHEPMKTFMKSQRPFPTIEIDNGITWNNDEAVKKFFTSIGSETKTLILSLNTNVERYKPILNSFPTVVELIATQLDLHGVLTNLEVPSTVMRLHVAQAANLLKQKYVRQIQHLDCLTSEMLWIMFKSHQDTEMVELFSTQECHSLVQGNFPFVSVKVREFNLVAKKQLMLKNIIKISEGSPLFYSHHFLTATIRRLTNLMEIYLKPYNDGGCFFMHDVSDMKSIRKIELESALLRGSECKTCHTVLFQSCPNMNELKLWECGLRCFDFSKWPKLKRLDTNYSKIPLSTITRQPRAKAFQNLIYLKLSSISDWTADEWMKWPSMPCLKHLRIEMGSRHSSQNIGYAHIVAATPRIEGIEILEDHILLDTFKVMMNGWKYLQTLTLNLHPKSDEHIFLRQITCCKTLRCLTLYDLPFMRNKEFHWTLYRRLPMLREISGSVRTTYSDYTNKS